MSDTVVEKKKRVVGPILTKEIYERLILMLNNHQDKLLAKTLILSYRNDNNFIYYGSLFSKKLRDADRFISLLEIKEKLEKIVIRKARRAFGKGFYSSWSNWYWNGYIQLDDSLKKIMDKHQLKIK